MQCNSTVTYSTLPLNEELSLNSSRLMKTDNTYKSIDSISNKKQKHAVLEGCPVIRGSSELWKHFLPDTILQQLLIHICNIKLISYDKLKVQLIYTSSQHLTFVLCMHLMHPPREAASRGLPCSGTFTSRLFIAKNCFFMRSTFLSHAPPAFSIALFHISFSRLTAFFLRSVSSTARFLLHRKFVRLRVRSVNRGTSAPTGK